MLPTLQAVGSRWSSVRRQRDCHRAGGLAFGPRAFRPPDQRPLWRPLAERGAGREPCRMATKRAPTPFKLYFVVDDAEFEADFVVARTEPQACRVFRDMYGHDAECFAELLTYDHPPAWLTEPVWLGPDDAVLVELGGRRLDSIGVPRWQFGNDVWGYPYTDAERYTSLLDLHAALVPKAPA